MVLWLGKASSENDRNFTLGCLRFLDLDLSPVLDSINLHHSLEAFLNYKNYVYHTYILRSIVRLKYIFKIIIYHDHRLTTSPDNECILTKHFIKECKSTVVMICSHFKTLNQLLNSAGQGPSQYIMNKIPLFFLFGFNYLLFWKPFSFWQ